MTVFGMPHWVGLLDAAGVLAVLVVAAFVTAGTPRAVLGACGGALLVLATGQAVDRVATFAFALAYPSSLGGDGGSARRWEEAGLGLAALAVGLFVATRLRDVVPVAVEEVAEEPAEEPPPLPVSVWSRTEVIGDAPEASPDDPPGEPPAPPAPPITRHSAAVPFLAIAVGLALPLYALSSTASLRYFNELFRFHVGPYAVSGHVLSGAVAGLALAGAAVALGVRDRRLVAVGFVLVAAGVGVQAAFPRTFFNEWWEIGGAALAVGLLVPAVIAALRHLVDVDRRSLFAGVAAAMLLVTALSVVSARMILERQRVRTQFSQFEEGG